MSEYMFVLGKNWILSIAELITYLETHGLRTQVVDHSKSVVVVRLEHELDEESIIELQSSLGGCFKTGQVIAKYNRTLVEKAYPKKGRFSKSSRRTLLKCPWWGRVWKSLQGQRIHFGVSTYPMEKGENIDVVRMTQMFSEALKEHLLELGARKAAYILYREPDRRDSDRPNTALWPQTIARHNLLHPPNAEILMGLTDSKLYIARTLAVYDSILQQYRDEARPFVSAEISTSPKMCRTLLNLARARKGSIVLDPFCGTGTLLMEAAILGIRCIGIDIDPEKVQGAKSNLKWLSRELGESIDCRVFRGDARRLSEIIDGTVDAIATEPDLGPIYHEPPTKEETRNVVKELTGLYNSFLKSASRILVDWGLVAMTIPIINTTEESIRLDLEKIVKGSGMIPHRFIPKSVIRPVLEKPSEIALQPERKRIPERKRGQIVQREIIVLGHG